MLSYEIRPMQQEEAEAIVNWQYEDPYSIYNMGGAKEAVEELTAGTYFAMHDDNQKLIGYFCFGGTAQVPGGEKAGAYSDKDFIDIGLGLKPDLCGLGNGADFIMKGLKYAGERFNTSKFRLTVAEFNKRAIKVYKKLGFKEGVRFTRPGKNDEIYFMSMQLIIKV